MQRALHNCTCFFVRHPALAYYIIYEKMRHSLKQLTIQCGFYIVTLSQKWPPWRSRESRNDHWSNTVRVKMTAGQFARELVFFKKWAWSTLIHTLAKYYNHILQKISPLIASLISPEPQLAGCSEIALRIWGKMFNLVNARTFPGHIKV